MTDPPQIVTDPYLQRVAQAVHELAKGMKTVSFYPPDHPTLIQSLSKIVLSFEDIPLPETGLEIDVTRSALLHNDTPLPGTGTIKVLSDLNRELFLRRAARIIFLPNVKPEEVFSFLKIITLDADQVLDSGGLEQARVDKFVKKYGKKK